MSIETRIPGSAASVRRAGEWVGSRLRPAVASAVDAFVDARTVAGGDWRGEAGTAFEASMGRAVTETRPLTRAVASVRTVFLDYADSLESCQRRMEGIRDDALAVGLTVGGSVIEAPSAGSPLVPAYDDLALRAVEVWTDLERSWERVAAADRAMDTAAWTFALGGAAGDLAGAVATTRVSALRGSAQHLADVAGDPGAGRVAGPGRLANLRRVAPAGLGGLMAVGGAVYDYRVRGESAEQAVASNAGGFAASVASGALVGTALGGPLGTVVGGAVGLGVGVFTSGTIDGLWEHDGDVSDALLSGWDTVVDTGDALVDVGGAIVDGIGGLLD